MADDKWFVGSEDENEEGNGQGFSWNITPEEEEVEEVEPQPDVEEPIVPNQTQQYIQENIVPDEEEESLLAQEEEVEPDEGFFQNSWNKIKKLNEVRTNTKDAWAAWSLRTVGGLLSSLELLPAMAYDTTAKLIQNPLADLMGVEEMKVSYAENFENSRLNILDNIADVGAMASNLGNEISPLLKTNGDFESNLSNGNWGEAAEQLYYMVNENLPQIFIQLGIAAMTGGSSVVGQGAMLGAAGASAGATSLTGLGMIGLSKSGGEYSKLKEEGKLETQSVYNNAVAKGFSEIAAQAVFSQPYYKHIFKTKGTQQAFIKALDGAAGRLVTSTGLNISEENLVNIIDNFADNATGNYDEEMGKIPLTQGWKTTSVVAGSFGGLTGSLDIYLSEEQQLKRKTKKIEAALEKSLEQKTPVDLIKQQVDNALDEEIAESYPEVNETNQSESDIMDSEGDVLNEQEGEQQGQTESPEEYRKVLEQLEEEAEAKGILPEGVRGTVKQTNDRIAQSTIKKFEPMTPNGSPSFEINDSELYYEAVVKGKESNDFGAFVDESNPEDLAGKRLFLYNGGTSGFALESDGNITNVFKNDNLTTEDNLGDEMLLRALKEGGNKLDFFDGKLTVLYGEHGFTPVAKTPFVDEFSPEGWNYDRDGKPPVVFAVHNGDSIETVIEKGQAEEGGYSPETDYNVEETPEVPDYGAGKEAQFAAMAEMENQAATEQVELSDVEKLAKESLTEREFLERLFVDEEIDFTKHDLDSSAEARAFWQEITEGGTKLQIDAPRETTDTKLESLREQLEEVDTRTKEGRALKQKIANLEQIKSFEDLSTKKIYEELQNRRDQLEDIDTRTKEGRQIKEEIAALESLTKRRKLDAVFEKQIEQKAAWMRQANKNTEEEINQYVKDLEENGVKVTDEQKQKLATVIKPSEGFAFNTTRIIDVDASVQQVILDIANISKDETVKTFEDLETDAEETFGNKDVAGIAKELGILDKDARVVAKMSEKIPDIAYRLRQVIASNAKVIAETANMIADSSATLSEIELAMFGQRVAVQESLTHNLNKIVGNSARTTSLQRAYVDGEMVDMYNLTPQQFLDSPDAQAKSRDIVDSFGGRGQLVKLAENIVNKVEGQTDGTNTINESIRESSFSANLLDALIEYRSSNVLMNMSTHLTNIISQTGRMVMDDFIDYIGATYNVALGHEDAMTYGKARAQLLGNLEGIKNAFVNPVVPMKVAGEMVLDKKPSTMDLVLLAAKDPKTFEEIREATQFTKDRMETEGFKNQAMDKHELFSESFNNGSVTKFVGYALDYYGAVARNLAFGGLQAGDAPFATAGYYRAMASELYDIKQTLPADMSADEQKAYLKDIKNKVVTYRKMEALEPLIERQILIERAQEAEGGRSEAQIRSDVIEEHVGDGLRGLKPKDMEQIVEIDAAAVQYSKEVTWKDSFEQGTLGKSLETLANNHRWIKLMQMFIHTPAKIFSYAYDNSINPETWAAAIGKRSNAEQTRALGGITATALVMAAGAMLYKSNHLTPAARDRKERERMYQAGVVPNSFRIGDKWYSFNRIEPMSYYLSMASSASRAVEEALADNDGSGIPTKALRVVGDTSISMMQTMLDKSYFKGLTDIMSAVTGDGSRYYAENFASSMAPLYSLKRNVLDYTYGGANPFYQKNLMESSGLVKRDIFGEPIVQYKSPTGMNPTPMSKSPIRQEIYDLPLNLSGFGKTFGGVTLDETQRDELLRYFNEELQVEEEMNELVRSPSYQNLDTIEQKKDALNSKWLSLKSAARRSLFMDSEYMKEYKEAQLPSNESQYKNDMFRDGSTTQEEEPKKDIVEEIEMFTE